MKPMNSRDLHNELAESAMGIAPFHLKHLVKIGVLLPTIAEMGRHHFSLGARRVVPTDEGLFYPDQEGALHLIVPVFENHELVDLCAFRSGEPKTTLLRSGHGWILGLENGLEPLIASAECDGPVPVWASPLEWMQNGTTGLCILDWDAPEIRLLLDIPKLHCSSATLAEMLRKKLTVPVRLPVISCEEKALAA